ncbi:hypothetical protein FLW98_26830 [Raoultella planticola]|uniref:hypothetical protein n=1 Tax=Raoultella planticola TaxID=575 RepID=UPI0011523869|nr:hypothetical protein [Raoultella planticola]TQN52823.1 hypothetical protein FLW98_26830 [Raoultella planticola]
MDAYISYQSLLAYRESADWAFWAMVAAWLSAFLTIVTLLIAGFTLNTWRKQEALKLKVNLKQSVLELETFLEAMPVNWSFVEVNTGRMMVEQFNTARDSGSDNVLLYYKKKDLEESFRVASKCWIMCDGLFQKSEVSQDWRMFDKQFRDYLRKSGDKHELELKLKAIYTNMKLFG